ncbi:MAG: flippase-like domain-containing protein [Cytophagales bacterium]|nr:flippase-like domain-containing protein [Cytophagales bacterium]MDW8385146.1 lysylphosphatidylglycerol synthase transmembrane domain-containing protein [Flammeovirgaceae bacterium]
MGNRKQELMEVEKEQILKKLNPNQIILPVTIGLLVVIGMIFLNGNLNIQQIIAHLKKAHWIWIAAAIGVLLARDLGYMMRIRMLTNNLLSWKAAFYIVMLWEFSSAITPSVVGGTAVAVFIINREKIPFGKSLAYVLLTAGLDNLFFVVASLTVFLIFPADIFPNGKNTLSLFGYELPLQYIFGISAFLIAIYTILMLAGLLVTPRAFKWVAEKLADFPLLKRWRSDLLETADDIVLASDMLKEYSIGYWVKAWLITIFIWSARYGMVNCLVAAFTEIQLYDHFVIFARQIIMWIIMLISPTPGSSGTAEYFFQLFFDHYFPIVGFSIVVALFWRIFTYYTYLLVGAVVLPKWLKRVLSDK